MAEQEPEDVQRWTTKRKAALVLSIIKGETSIQEAACQHRLTVAEIVLQEVAKRHPPMPGTSEQ